MIGILIGAAGALAVLAYWVAGASYVYCRLSRHMDLFVFPYDQWFAALGYWDANGRTKLFIVISAAAPVVLAAAVGRMVYLRYQAGGGQKVYGTSQWAGSAEMTRGGISFDRAPF